MRLFTQGEKTQAAGAQRKRGGLVRRVCSLAMALGIVLELCGGLPGSLILPVSAEETGFSYQPGSMGLAVLPRDEVFSVSKLQNLEAAWSSSTTA